MTKTASLKRLDPNKTSCPVEGCKIPRGQRGNGLVPGAGVAMHMSRYHKDQPTQLTETDKQVVAAAEAAQGTPGDSKVIGEAMSLDWASNVKQILDAPTSDAQPFELLPRMDEMPPGIAALAIREGTVYTWTDGGWKDWPSLDSFVGALRLAIWAVSR